MTKKEAIFKISASVLGKEIPLEATDLARFIIEEAEKIGMVPPLSKSEYEVNSCTSTMFPYSDEEDGYFLLHQWEE